MLQPHKAVKKTDKFYEDLKKITEGIKERENRLIGGNFSAKLSKRATEMLLENTDCKNFTLEVNYLKN